MNIATFNTTQLADFVKSDVFVKLNPKPITLHRALSQTLNPRAETDDIILIIAYTNEFKLLGYIGSLPDNLNIKGQKRHIAWNSCWWSNPENGKIASLKLFAEMNKAWNYEICYCDLDEKGKNFIDLTHNYNLAPYDGNKFVFRSYLATYVASQHKYLNHIATKIIFGFVDFWINSVGSLIQYTGLPADETLKLPETHDELPADAAEFLKKFDTENISGRSTKEFEWILQNPWISTNKSVLKEYSESYFFSHSAKKLKNYFLVFREKKQIYGVILVQNRDNHFRLPYVFFDPEKLKTVGNALLKHLVLRRANTLNIYHPRLVSFIANKNNFLTKKPMKRYAALPKSWGDIPDGLYIQDGDGDAVFC